MSCAGFAGVVGEVEPARANALAATCNSRRSAPASRRSSFAVWLRASRKPMPHIRAGAFPPRPPTRPKRSAWAARAGMSSFCAAGGQSRNSWTVEACDAQGCLALPADVVRPTAYGGRTLARHRVTVPWSWRWRMETAASSSRWTRPRATQRLRPGMTVAHAQSLIPDLSVMNATPDEDEAALSELGLWCTRYSPLVTPEPAGWNLHRHRGLGASLQGRSRALERSRSASCGRAACRPRGRGRHAGRAWAVARFGDAGVIAPGRIADALGAACRSPRCASHRTIIESLHDVGIERIAQLATKPRSTLQTRFGADASPAPRPGARHRARGADLARTARSAARGVEICGAGRLIPKTCSA